MTRFEYKVGDKFLIVQNWSWHSRQFAPVTVEKVYKNGNAVLQGIEGQWRQDGFPTKRNAWDRRRLQPDTEELRADINAERRIEQCRTKIKALGDALLKSANHCEDPVGLWESLPEEVRKLAD